MGDCLVPERDRGEEDIDEGEIGEGDWWRDRSEMVGETGRDVPDEPAASPLKVLDGVLLVS